MQLTELDFPYPERLVATERKPKSRVMWVDSHGPQELARLEDLVSRFCEGDMLVINNTRVLRRRVWTLSGLEILFLQPVNTSETQQDSQDWEVLCPASRWKDGETQRLPMGVELRLVSRGKPQVVRANQVLSDAYFQEVGELPLPPYIQKARGDRHNRPTDKTDYQTAWAQIDGSLAAPTASLHFSTYDLTQIRERGVEVVEITLHVGLGTFLPIQTPKLSDHVMHAETISLSQADWKKILAAKSRGGRVWALGTTVARSLESVARGMVPLTGDQITGETRLFIYPPFEFQIVDVLLTNFHQPQSTLLALVAAFAGSDIKKVKSCYQWAIEREFRLFSYGDLTVWSRE